MINRYLVMDIVLTCVMVLSVKYVVAADPGCPACPDAKTGDEHACPAHRVAGKQRSESSGCPGPRCSDNTTAALLRQLQKQAQCNEKNGHESVESKFDATSEATCPCARGECDGSEVAKNKVSSHDLAKWMNCKNENAKCDGAKGECAAKQCTTAKAEATVCKADAESTGHACQCKEKCCGDNCQCGTKQGDQLHADEAKHAELVPGETAEAILRIKEQLDAQAGSELHCPGLNIDLDFNMPNDHEAQQTQLIEVLRDLDAEHRSEQEEMPMPEDVGTECELVTQDQAEALRESCASLERTAAQLEAAELYDQADMARQLADDLREEARQAAARLRPNVLMSSTPVHK